MSNQSDKELDKLFNDAIKKIRKMKIKPRWYKEVYDKKVCSSKDFLKYFGVK